MNDLCSETLMHHVGIGVPALLCGGTVVLPHKVLFEQPVNACHQSEALTHCRRFIPHPISRRVSFLKHTHTHKVIMHTHTDTNFNQSDKAGAESSLTSLHVIN